MRSSLMQMNINPSSNSKILRIVPFTKSYYCQNLTDQLEEIEKKVEELPHSKGIKLKWIDRGILPIR